MHQQTKFLEDSPFMACDYLQILAWLNVGFH